MTTPHTVYFNEAPVDQSDYPAIAEKFKLPYEVVSRCIEALQQTGSIPVMAFSGKVRERVKIMDAEVLSIPISKVDQNAPQEPAEALYDDAKEIAERLPLLDEQQQIKNYLNEFPISEKETQSIVDPDEFDPEETTEQDEIVEHAAHGLMDAFSDSEGCFIISEDGCCRINPDKPPTIQHSLTVVANVLKLKDLGSVVDDKSSWMLGSIIASLEDFHGENFAVSQVCDSTTKAYNTVVTAVGVFKAFKLKRYKLSFSSHKEAHYAKIPDAHKRLILHKAETFKIGPKSIRALCTIAKTMEDDTTIRNIRSQKQALDLIAAYKEAKVIYVVYNEGEWTRMTGLAVEPPEGKIVLNLKDWTAQAGNQIVQIQKHHTAKP